MNGIQAIKTLENYKSSLVEIENRFTHDHTGIHINIDDITEVKRLVIELRDAFNDLFQQDDYSQLVINSYEEGTSNMYGSPSLHCVKDLQAIIS